MSTLQFTQRLGYRKKNAIQMLTMGCYNALWALRTSFEARKNELDDHDRQAYQLTRKWMGIESWPEAFPEQEQLRKIWHCQRTACTFHAQHCPHGAHMGKQS
jgi:hypothetical protein